MTAQPDPLALAMREFRKAVWGADDASACPSWIEKGVAAALRADQDARPAAEGVEQFLLAYVSQDAKIIGIEHDTDADWHEVQRAHEALRDRLNVRLAERDKCPVKPAPDAVAAAMAERESDGYHWSDERFGDNVAPERTR